MINVKLPNGSTAQFPDGMPPAEIERVLAEQFGGQSSYDAAATNAGAPVQGMPQPFAGSQPVAPRNAQPAVGRPDIMGSTAATLGGIVNSVPVIGPLAQNASDAMIAGGGMLTDAVSGNSGRSLNDLVSGNERGFWDRMEELRARREELAAANPIANVAGNVGGGLAAFGLGGSTKAGAEALGASGPLLQRVANSGLSMLGLGTADNMVRGQAPVEAMTNAAGPALFSAGVPVAGALIKKGAQGIANAATRGAQTALTSRAIVGAPTSSEIKSAASQMFETATGGNPIAVSDNAFFRFLGGVKQVADKFRINADNDKQAVGLLNTMMRVADDTASGTVVDMKDLHLIRQLAGKVAQSAEGRDGEFARLVIRQMDDFIQTLKPADILGGADPSQAANSLMRGISTWSRANKVAAVEEAIRVGQLAASGPEKGVRNALRALMRNPDVWRGFNKAEQQAISEVVEGTTGSNLLKLLGTFGFGNNAATNGIGGAAGMALGQMAGGPVGMVLGPVIGGVARKASEQMTDNLAQRALGAVATPNLPIAIPRQVPQALNQGVSMAELLARERAMAASRP